MNISKIKIHPLFYIVILFSLLTGHFKDIIAFTSLIIVHEIGHITTAIICRWKINKIILLPFGGITIFDTLVNRSIKEEFFIAISGPIFQTIFFLLFKEHIKEQYHIALLLFNLIPIFPLDGYKIITLLLYNILPFKLTNYLFLIISEIISILLIIYYKNIMFLIIIVCLIIKTNKEILNQKLIFNKFITERYIYNFNFKKTKKVNKVSKMLLNKNHIFKVGKNLINERDYLHKMFDNTYRIW